MIEIKAYKCECGRIFEQGYDALKCEMCREEFRPRKFEDFTQEEIVDKFKGLWDMAVGYYNAITQGDKNLDIEDAEHYMFEAVVDLLGDGVWGEINNHL